VRLFGKTLIPCWLALAALVAPAFANAITLTNFQPVIVGGSASGSPPDSPANRVDANTTTSPFGGIGSLQLAVPNVGTFICSGTPIDATHVVTAAHCLDLVGSDGTIDLSPANVTFNLNFGGDLTSQIAASALAIHPNYTGFNNPSINDDIALVTLGSPLPGGVPLYPLYSGTVLPGTVMTMVGYGQSGFGDVGFTVGPSFTVKRTGRNAADGFIADDEGGGFDEVFFFDFDGPDGTTNYIGGLTLGNDIEATLGGGDSGGPSLIFNGNTWELAGVNTFLANFSGGPGAPLFGSAGGGMLISPYGTWISGLVAAMPEPGGLLLFALGLVLLSLTRPSFRPAGRRVRCR
jgi:hypothetical protein